MKLRLSSQQTVQILDVLEELKPEHATVLTTGIKKLLQSGKNRIVINLTEAKQLTVQILKELFPLHPVASELSGGIVFVGQGDLVKQAIQSLESPISVKYFSTVDAAVKSFLTDPKPKNPILEGPDGELRIAIAKLETENKVLKGKLQSAGLDEIKKIRLENAEFKKQLTAAEEQLRLLLKDRKKPTDLEGMQIKIEQLETALKDALDKNNAAALAPAAPKTS